MDVFVPRERAELVDAGLDICRVTRSRAGSNRDRPCRSLPVGLDGLSGDVDSQVLLGVQKTASHSSRSSTTLCSATRCRPSRRTHSAPRAHPESLASRDPSLRHPRRSTTIWGAGPQPVASVSALLPGRRTFGDVGTEVGTLELDVLDGFIRTHPSLVQINTSSYD